MISNLVQGILDRYWLAPRYGFVMWTQGAIHYEAVSRPGSNIQTPESLRAFSFRAVIGTHTPIELTPMARRQLCFLVEHSWIPEIYKHKHHNDATAIAKNMVNAKSTQYMKPRHVTRTEVTILEQVRTLYTDANISRYIETLPCIIREMYGIY